MYTTSIKATVSLIAYNRLLFWPTHRVLGKRTVLTMWIKLS